MKDIKDFLINESNNEWCLWDYKENGVHEILIWKGNGKDQSQISDIDENGTELMNVSFEEIIKYCEKHKNDNVDKFHLDFLNAKWNKIKDIF